MQCLTPSGKTTVETAYSAIYLKKKQVNHNPDEVKVASAERKSVTTSTNDLWRAGHVQAFSYDGEDNTSKRVS